MTGLREIFPRPTSIPTRPCAKCGTDVQLRNLVAGAYGEDCAEQLGLTVSVPRRRTHGQTGPTLFDNADEDDSCDGWDR